MIEIRNLYKSFSKQQVLRGIDLHLKPPGIVTILGPNGSGKTTLIKSILNMVVPDSGEIMFDGKAILNQWLYRAKISYQAQVAHFPENLKVAELINMVKDVRPGATRDLEMIRYFELDSFLHKRLRYLSGGMNQKVNLVLALMYDSPVLILDEPGAGLDPVSNLKLKALLGNERNRNKLILISTHLLHFVEEMADQIVFLLDGRIEFQGTVKSILEKHGEKNLEVAIASLLQSNTAKQNGNTGLHYSNFTKQALT